MANLPTSIKNLNTLLGEQLAEGGGGGGSSDMGVAAVTLVNNSTDSIFLDMPMVRVIPHDSLGSVTISGTATGDPQTTEEINVAIAKQGCVVPIVGVSQTFSLDGNASLVGEGLNRGILITGDCTITVS